MNRTRRTVAVLAAALSATLAAGCSSSEGPPEPVTPGSVVVTDGTTPPTPRDPSDAEESPTTPPPSSPGAVTTSQPDVDLTVDLDRSDADAVGAVLAAFVDAYFDYSYTDEPGSRAKIVNRLLAKDSTVDTSVFVISESRQADLVESKTTVDAVLEAVRVKMAGTRTMIVDMEITTTHMRGSEVVSVERADQEATLFRTDKGEWRVLTLARPHAH